MVVISAFTIHSNSRRVNKNFLLIFLLFSYKTTSVVVVVYSFFATKSLLCTLFCFVRQIQLFLLDSISEGREREREGEE